MRRRATIDEPGGYLGPYRIDGVLGRGGMGIVYSGYDERLERPVALKRVRRIGADDEAARRQLRREARALARIHHPAVVQVYDMVEAADSDWIVMELVRGRTLSQLAKAGEISPERAVRIAREVAEGLAAAHDHGIVHRDLKTENVMVGAGGRASHVTKLLDFGLARRLLPSGLPDTSSATPADQLRGTVRALSPEQVLGRGVDGRCDLFAFGVLLYEILTGRSPFLAESPARTLRHICETAHLPIREARPELPEELSGLVDELLSKEPELRPPSAAVVAQRLERIRLDVADPEASGEDLKPAYAADTTLGVRRAAPAAALRTWPPPELPDEPYPVLLPYTHPELMAGREQELEEVRMQLRRPLPIFGLGAASGTGKSSFLLGGLVPGLRAEGHPVAVVRHPQEAGVAARLVGDLVDTTEDGLVDEEDWQGFVRRLEEVAQLSGKTPLLVLDQFENVLRNEEDGAARARLGILLAATAQRRPGREEPLCRWLLAYRQEYHGELLAWLGDVLSEAAMDGAAMNGALGFLPYELSGPDRFQSLTLTPFATPPPAGDPHDEVRKCFLAAVEKPLRLSRYGLRFAPGHAQRLARAFAEARRARPEEPLVPELQVVLAHLVSRARPDQGADRTGLITVPEDVESLVEEALADHLRAALEAAFPSGGAVETHRARALLALRELASADGRRGQGLPAEELARAIGPEGRPLDGEAILERLATPLTRLVVPRDTPAGLCYALSHDRMAEVVVRMVEEEGRRGKLLVDAELLALHHFVALKEALHASTQAETSAATRIPRRHYRTIAAHSGALLPDEARRAWWAACRRRHRADLVRAMALATAVLVFLVVLTWGTWSWMVERGRHRALLEQVALGEPEEALRALGLLADDPRTSARELLALLRRRPVKMDVLENGLGEVSSRGGEGSAVVLQAVEIALPWVDDTPQDPILIANLVWALDYGPSRDKRHAARALALRERVLEPLRTLRPPPEVRDPDWIRVPSGTFRVQRHEVTNAEYRLLFPNHEGEDGLPVTSANWYEAYTYAAWLGGRLPTEAEWEYAARAGCAYDYCTRDGLEATVDDVAWTLRNSLNRQTGRARPSPVMRLEPNPWGLYDMLGNSWEWTADWFAETVPLPAGSRPLGARLVGPRGDAWGPAGSGSRRVTRGGSFGSQAFAARVTFRHSFSPDFGRGIQGFRVVLELRSL